MTIETNFTITNSTVTNIASLFVESEDENITLNFESIGIESDELNNLLLTGDTLTGNKPIFKNCEIDVSEISVTSITNIFLDDETSTVSNPGSIKTGSFSGKMINNRAGTITITQPVKQSFEVVNTEDGSVNLLDASITLQQDGTGSTTKGRNITFSRLSRQNRIRNGEVIALNDIYINSVRKDDIFGGQLKAQNVYVTDSNLRYNKGDSNPGDIDASKVVVKNSATDANINCNSAEYEKSQIRGGIVNNVHLGPGSQFYAGRLVNGNVDTATIGGDNLFSQYGTPDNDRKTLQGKISIKKSVVTDTIEILERSTIEIEDTILGTNSFLQDLQETEYTYPTIAAHKIYGVSKIDLTKCSTNRDHKFFASSLSFNDMEVHESFIQTEDLTSNADFINCSIVVYNGASFERSMINTNVHAYDTIILSAAKIRGGSFKVGNDDDYGIVEYSSSSLSDNTSEIQALLDADTLDYDKQHDIYFDCADTIFINSIINTAALSGTNLGYNSEIYNSFLFDCFFDGQTEMENCTLVKPDITTTVGEEWKFFDACLFTSCTFKDYTITLEPLTPIPSGANPYVHFDDCVFLEINNHFTLRLPTSITDCDETPRITMEGNSLAITGTNITNAIFSNDSVTLENVTNQSFIEADTIRTNDTQGIQASLFNNGYFTIQGVESISNIPSVHITGYAYQYGQNIYMWTGTEYSNDIDLSDYFASGSFYWEEIYTTRVQADTYIFYS